jgi:hypothetical protein
MLTPASLADWTMFAVVLCSLGGFAALGHGLASPKTSSSRHVWRAPSRPLGPHKGPAGRIHHVAHRSG